MSKNHVHVMCQNLCSELNFNVKKDKASYYTRRILNLPRSVVNTVYKKAFPSCSHHISPRLLCETLFASYFNDSTFLKNFWSSKKVLIFAKPDEQNKNPRLMLFNKDYNRRNKLSNEELDQLNGLKYNEISWDVEDIISCSFKKFNSAPNWRRKYNVKFHGFDDTCSIDSIDLDEAPNKISLRDKANEECRNEYPKRFIPNPSCPIKKIAYAEIYNLKKNQELHDEFEGIQIEVDESDCLCNEYNLPELRKKFALIGHKRKNSENKENSPNKKQCD